VLGSHTSVLPLPFGTLGVLLFFNLSAFLLSLPFLLNDQIYSLRGTAGFFIRRAFRIMPMLIVYVFTYGIFVDGELKYIIDNIIRFRGYGHLWTINQEMLFYALMPTFAWLVFPLRRRPLFAAAIFVSLAIAADHYLTYQVFQLPGMTSYMQFFLSPFLIGMASAYLVPSIMHLRIKLNDSRLLNSLISVAIIGCVIVVQWSMVRMYVETGLNVVGNWALFVSVCYCTLLLWIASVPENWLDGILSYGPLRLVGIVGYSFYLWHWIPVSLLPQDWVPILRFSIAFIATFSVSLATFFIIERPGIRLGAKLASFLPRPSAMKHCPRNVAAK